MNLTKLYETQKILRDRIIYDKPDRFYKLVLALLVELGECANEYRAWKFWSNDQEPRREKLLEEYVDGLHFVLEVGLESNFKPEYVGIYRYESITRQFKELYWEISDLEKNMSMLDYVCMFAKYVGLGEMLGFSWSEIEQAYYEKNQINHIRQDTGY